MAAFFPRNYNSCHGSAEPGFTSLFRLLDDFDSYSRSQSPTGASTTKQARRQHLPTFQPKFDVRETEKTYELHGELAGMNKQDVHVEFSDPQTMIIRGHIERSYTAGTPPSAAIDNTSAAADSTIEDRPATPTTTTAAATDDNESVSRASISSSGSHKATVADEEDEEQFTEVATPTTTTAETKPSFPEAAESATAVAQTPTTPKEAAAADSKPVDTAKYWVSERSIGEFSRSFNFPQRVEHDSVTASLNNGVLTVTVPKAKRHQVRRISVE